MDKPFERIAIDIVGPLPHSHKGYQYVLVICDYTTRYPEAITLHCTDAHQVAEELIQEWEYHVKFSLTKRLTLCLSY